MPELAVTLLDDRGLMIDALLPICEMDCISVVAVAHGGTPPYRFEWSDGVVSAEREACAVQASRLRVTVTDARAPDEEPGNSSATATVLLRVEACPDAGGSASDGGSRVMDGGHGADGGMRTPDSGQPTEDASVPHGPLCFDNPSFEGSTGNDVVPSGWTTCNDTPDTLPITAGNVLPSAGDSYLGIHRAPTNWEAVGTTLCAPLRDGSHVAMLLDVGLVAVFGDLPARLEVWGGTTLCGKDELLWSSSPIANTDSWSTICGSLSPASDYSHLLLQLNHDEPPPPGPGSYLAIDNLNSATDCPQPESP